MTAPSRAGFCDRRLIVSVWWDFSPEQHVRSGRPGVAVCSPTSALLPHSPLVFSYRSHHQTPGSCSPPSALPHALLRSDRGDDAQAKYTPPFSAPHGPLTERQFPGPLTLLGQLGSKEEDSVTINLLPPTRPQDLQLPGQGTHERLCSLSGEVKRQEKGKTPSLPHCTVLLRKNHQIGLRSSIQTGKRNRGARRIPSLGGEKMRAELLGPCVGDMAGNHRDSLPLAF